MNVQVQNSLSKVLVFLDQLEKHKISYRLEHVRDSLMVTAAIPGERWEIEFFEDGSVEVEKFLSPGKIEGEETLQTLIAQHGSGE